MAEAVKIMLVAGEPSGDALAAKLVGALREADSDREFEFFGSAGPRMRNLGVEPTVFADDLAIMGPIEIVKAMPLFLNAVRKLKEDRPVPTTPPRCSRRFSGIQSQT